MCIRDRDSVLRGGHRHLRLLRTESGVLRGDRPGEPGEHLVHSVEAGGGQAAAVVDRHDHR
eukprot:3874411-Pyramimonas_sp.AAC.1